ncbi:MAG: hypothetical protein JNK15_24420 [Planctomycetes bacterium]|nr:hypothetical protein [Planctomycetota bacterium]
MSPTVAAFVGALFGGGVAAVVAGSLLAPRGGDEVRPQAPAPVETATPVTPATPPRAESAPTVVATGSPASTSLDQRLAAIEAKLESLVAASARTPLSPSGGTAVVDVSSLQQALEEVERRKFETMPDAQLRELAWRGGGKGGDAAAALRAIDLLLARAKSPEDRAALLHQKAVTCRTLGGEADLNESLRCLEQVVAENGVGSRAGIDAANQMVWTMSAQKNHAGALRQAESIVANAGANRQQRLWARWSIAVVSGSAGDSLRERSELEALQRDLGNDPEYEKLAQLVRERLNPTRK